MKKTLLLVGAPAVLVASLLATAGEAAPGSFVDGVTQDCRDIGVGDRGGSGSYQRMVDDIALADEVAPGTGYYRSYAVTLQDRGVVEVSAPLAVPSCTDVTYTLTVYRAEFVGGRPVPGAPLVSTAVQGDGVSKDLVLTAVPHGYTSSVVFAQVVTSDKRGTYDSAPDAPTSLTANGEGTPNGTGGATSSFK